MSPPATMDTSIMDRRQEDAANYEYVYVGVGVLDRKSGRFFAELPDDPESADLIWTIGVELEYYLACHEKRGHFCSPHAPKALAHVVSMVSCSIVLSNRIHKPSWVLIAVARPL